jgi:hypothetical protein
VPLVRESFASALTAGLHNLAGSCTADRASGTLDCTVTLDGSETITLSQTGLLPWEGDRLGLALWNASVDLAQFDDQW